MEYLKIMDFENIVNNPLKYFEELHQKMEDRQQACIVLPYYYVPENLYDLEQKVCFNEYTCKEIEKTGFKVLKMEFLYKVDYKDLTQEEQEYHRKHDLNVVDYIIFQILNIKNTWNEDEQFKFIDFEEPIEITLKKIRDEREVFRRKSMKLQQKLDEKSMELQDLKRFLKIKEEEFQEMKEHDFENLKTLFAEHNAIKDNRMLKISDILKYKQRDMSVNLNKEASELLEESILQSTKDLNGFIMSRSPFITKNQMIHYDVIPQKDNWKGMKMVFTNFLTKYSGVIMALEIVDPIKNIILRSIPLGNFHIEHDTISTLEFEPIEDSKNKLFRIRLMGINDVESYGISIFEWKKLAIKEEENKIEFFGVLIYD